MSAAYYTSGKQTFLGDVSFNNANTLVSSNLVNISGGTIRIDSSNVVFPKIPTATNTTNVVYFDSVNKTMSYGAAPSGGGGGGIEPRPLNNTWTGYNTFSNDVSFNNATTLVSSNLVNISGGTVRIDSSNVVFPKIPTATNTTNVVYFDSVSKTMSYGAAPSGGGGGIEPRPLNNTWTGYNTFSNDVSFNNSSTQINSTTTTLGGTTLNVNSTTTTLGGTTSNLNSAITSVNGSSLNVNSTTTTLGGTTSNLNSAITSVNGSSLNVNSTTTTLGGTTLNVNSTTTTLGGSASNLNSTTTTIGGTTLNVNSTTTTLSGSSSNLNSTTTTIGGTTLNVNSTTTTLSGSSSNLNSAITSVNGSTLNVNSTTTTLGGSAANLNSAITSVNGSTMIVNSSNIGLSGDVINICGGVINIVGPMNISGKVNNLQTEILSSVFSSFGSSVSLSSDGNTMAVGSYYENSYKGAVRVYSRTGTSWNSTPDFVKLSDISSSQFGYSVALSPDGNVLAVGSPYEKYVSPTGPSLDIAAAGAVRIYIKTNGIWNTIPQNEILNDVDGKFGTSVALSLNGDTLIVGSPEETLNGDKIGKAYIFFKSGTSYNVNSGQTSNFADSKFGYSVAISSNGNTIAVVAPMEEGKVRIYKKYNEVFDGELTSYWNLEFEKINTNQTFGYSIALSQDGNTLAVGSSFENSNSGAVRVYFNNGGMWSTTPQIELYSSVSNSRFGASVDLSTDGNILAVGSTGENNCGVVHVYNRTGTSWNTTPIFDLTTGIIGSSFGGSVSLSSDGKTIAVGSQSENLTFGAARVYYIDLAIMDMNVSGIVRLGSNVYLPNIQDNIVTNKQLYIDSNGNITKGSLNQGPAGATGPDGPAGADGANGPAGLTGPPSSYANITEYNDNIGIRNTNPAYTLDVIGQTYMKSDMYGIQLDLNATLSIATSSPAYGDYINFGSSCALSGDGLTLAVGGPQEEINAQINAGAVRVYTRLSSTSTLWSAPTKLSIATSSPDYGSRANFGNSCALSSDGLTLVVGAFNERRLGVIGSGAVRLYIRTSSTSTWSGPYVLSPPVSGANFGSSCALSSDGLTLAVAAKIEEINQQVTAGSVRVYTRPSSTSISWSTPILFSIATLSPSYGNDIRFGSSCALSGDGLTLVVGSHQEEINAQMNAGAVRVYTRPSSTSTLWSAPTKLSPAIIYTQFGTSCALSSDGLTLAVGAQNETRGGQDAAGCVRVYTRPSSTSTSWSINAQGVQAPVTLSIATLSPPYGYGANFGSSCALSSDGLTLAVGAINETRGGQVGAGCVRVYTRPSSTSTSWSETPAKLSIATLSPDYGALAQFGSSCALSSNGLSLAVGAYTEIISGQNQAGSVRVYTKSSQTLYALDVAGNTRCTNGVWISSDKRIKNNVVDIDDGNALSILRKIQPKTYEYIDKKGRGNNTVIGFIAQEVQEIIPNACILTKDYIPNFYTTCKISHTDVSSIMLVSSVNDISWDDPGAFIDGSGNAQLVNQVFNVKLYDQNRTEIKCRTTSILDKRSFLIDVTGTRLETDELQEEYFLYGQEVDNFHNLDKTAIYTVVTAAVQDIDRIQQAQLLSQTQMQLQIQADSVKISALEQQVASLQSLTTSLESLIQSQNASFEARLAAKGI